MDWASAAADSGQLTISGGGSLTTDSRHFGAGQAMTASVWRGHGVRHRHRNRVKVDEQRGDSLAMAAKGTLSVTDGGEVEQTRESGGFFLGGGSMSVDGSSIAEAGTLGGAQGGLSDHRPQSLGWRPWNVHGQHCRQWLTCKQRLRGAFQGNGTLTVNGSVTGTGSVTVGAQETLALNGSVSLTGNGSVSFYGWYGTLAIGNAAGFSSTTPIYNFMPSDTIDLKNVPYVSAASSYSFTYGSNGGANDLKVTEGGQTYNLNVGSYYSLSGLLTLKRDAAAPARISCTRPAARRRSSNGDRRSRTFSSPRPARWTDPLGDLQFERRRPTGLDRHRNAGQPYVPGQAAPYSIVLTTQDWIGSEQPLVTVTTTNLVDPFGTGPQGLGNLAGSEFVSNNGATGTMDLIYWQASATPGDYAVEFQPITTTYVSAPSTGPSTVLTGAPTQLVAAVSQPLTWDHVDNYTSNSAATEGGARLRHLCDRNNREHVSGRLFHRRRGDDKPNIRRDDSGWDNV